LCFPNSNTGYAVGTNIYKTTNFGDNWVFQSNPVPYILEGVYFPNVNTGYACGENKLIKTSNGGNNWFVINIPLSNFYHLKAIFFTDTLTGYIVGLKYASDTSVFLKTTNGGINWIYQLFPANTWGKFSSLFFINANTGIVASTGNFVGSILKTTDAGSNWNQIMIPTANTVNSLYFPSASTGYGACYGGQIIKTTNGGNNWFLQNTGTGSILYGIFFVNNLTGYAGGDNSTVLKTIDGGGPPIGIKPIGNNVPDNYQLFQNYPNPFNPITHINFSLPKKSNVKIEIYNLIGEIIDELVNYELEAGTYSTEWDGTNFSSGMYFYSLVADGKLIDTKKMILIK
jgi:photosystem II stability/assembly factor-like uncharacterized protein